MVFFKTYILFAYKCTCSEFLLSPFFQSFSGHTSGVECVRFSGAEDMVVAGSVSGALKIWDLEAAKSMGFVSNFII